MKKHVKKSFFRDFSRKMKIRARKLKNEVRTAKTGIITIALMTLLAVSGSSMNFFGLGVPISPLIIGIVLGVFYSNSIDADIPDSWKPGVAFSAKRLLRLGIVLYGFNLTFQQLSLVGTGGILVSAIMLTSTMFIGLFFGIKLLKMDIGTTILTSAGSSICGAAAVLAAEGTIKTQAYKAGIAVATVVVFGTIALFLYPILYKTGILDMTEIQFGIFTGATVHEVAQVVAIGSAFDSNISDPAVVSKMIRVMMLTPFLLVISFVLATWDKNHPEKGRRKGSITIPWFAVGFLAVAGFNSFNLLPKEFVNIISIIDTVLLTMAMTALGLTTKFDKIKEAGAKPFYLGVIMFAWLTIGGYFITKLIV